MKNFKRLPADALPQKDVFSLNFRIADNPDEKNAAKIEIHLKKEAFWMVQARGQAPGQWSPPSSNTKRTISWKKHGVQDAWEIAKTATGWLGK